MGDLRVVAARVLVCFSLLFLSLDSVALAEGNDDIRTDELTCGSTKVQAVTTCATGAGGIFLASCSDQYFLFSDQTTGRTAKVETSVKPPAGDRADRTIQLWLNSYAVDWACLKGKTGPYVVIGYAGSGGFPTWGWDEVFDGDGRKVASNKGARTNDEIARYEEEWHSLGLPEPLPLEAFTPIQLFKYDRTFSESRVSAGEEGSNSAGVQSQKKLARKVKWLVFSATEHRHERELVIQHYRWLHQRARKGKGYGHVYIALADLKGDGTRQIFVYLTAFWFCPEMGCEADIYEKKGRRLVSLLGEEGDQTTSDIDRKGCQTNIGVLPSKTKGWHDIVTDHDIVWRWNGKRYDWRGTAQAR